LALIPTATGLNSASLALIAGKSSGMAAASCPSRLATRFTADCKSRNLVAESEVSCCNEMKRSAKVTVADLAASVTEPFVLHFFDMA
jgi:hypothetical protein